MQNFFSADGTPYRILTFIYHILIYNILWIICSIPIITIGASTTALFQVTEKVIKDEVNGEFKDFFRAFKKYFKKSTRVWLILLAMYLLIYINLTIAHIPSLKSYGFIIVCIQLPLLLQVIIININVFIMISNYEIPTLQLIKLSWIIGNKHIFTSIMCIATILAWTMISSKFIPLFVLLYISIAAMAIYILFGNIIKKYKYALEEI